MKTFCDYCGSAIDDTLEKCPNCGAVNRHMQRSGNQVPKTIEELQAFAAANNIPLEKMRFFVGVDYKEPRAFGIYKESNGNCVVYKNKADGSRAIRYQGADEAYAVNELYQKMKAEVLERKQADLNKGKSYTSTVTSAKGSGSKPKTARIGAYVVMLILLAILFISCVSNVVSSSHTPKNGYYEYKGTPYYYTGGNWYTPDEDGEWARDYNTPDMLEENYNDYFEAKDYSSLDSNYAGEVEEYQTEAYSGDSYDDDDSWGDSWDDSNWDDDDWDYDYDSYDSYDSDWDSDW